MVLMMLPNQSLLLNHPRRLCDPQERFSKRHVAVSADVDLSPAAAFASATEGMYSEQLRTTLNCDCTWLSDGIQVHWLGHISSLPS
jgi:hypothetical protein